MKLINITCIQKRWIQTVKPHVPLIKFRKGSSNDRGNSDLSHESGSFASRISRPVLEDYQLPLKYRRRPLDDREINVINSGGVY